MGDLWPVTITKSTIATVVNGTVQHSADYDDFVQSGGDLQHLELFKGYPEILLRFASLCCVTFMLVGIPGNLITIVALARCKKVRNATAVFIMNLSCSDLLFCCFNLPLAASTFWRRAWPHGRTLCRMFPVARYGLVAVSLFTVLAITINRYVMIGHPRLYPKLYQRKYLAIMVASTWACAFGALAATWFEQWGRFGLDLHVGSCSILPDRHGRSPKEFLFVVAFILPCFFIVVCYARIFCIVRDTARRTRRPHRAPAASTGTDDSALGSASPGPGAPRRALLAPPPPARRASPAPPERSSSSGVDTEEASPAPSRAAPRVRQPAGKLTGKDKRLLKMIMVIMVSFWVCYLPITLTKIFREFREYKGLNIAGYILIYLTTCINPIIYVVMSSEYRQAYKNLLLCRRHA